MELSLGLGLGQGSQGQGLGQGSQGQGLGQGLGQQLRWT